MEVFEYHISGVVTIRPVKHCDDRGFFSEVYNKRSLAEVGITDEFVQDNHSLSRDVGVVRGLHFQIDPHPIAKLVHVTRGAVLDVVVDIRHGSPTFGEHVAVELSAANWTQLYAPIGMAHGFCTLEPDTEVAYKVTDYWSPDVDRGLAWNDPDLGIDWPVDPEDAILSPKDRAQPRLADLPRYFAWTDA
jgi:dTDP-4-dehydrorhamnose 3,5-epimerase